MLLVLDNCTTPPLGYLRKTIVLVSLCIHESFTVLPRS